MKRIMKQLALLFTLLMGLVVTGKAQIGISTRVATDVNTIAIPAKNGENLTYRLTGTSTGTATLQYSKDGNSWYSVGIGSTTVNADPNIVGNITVIKDQMYRWSCSTITGGFFLMDLYAGPVVSTQTGSTRYSTGPSFPAYLGGTNAAVEGSVLISTTPIPGYGLSVLVSTGYAHRNWIGIAKNEASTGSVVEVYYDGFVLARTTGPVNTGDILVTTTTAGYLWGTQTILQSGAGVGVAMSSGPIAGGLTKVKIR